MTDAQWKYFCDFKDDLRSKIEEWKASAPELTKLQKDAAILAKTPEYPFETTVVYNRALDDITKDDDIKLIVIGDNPGKDEQLAKNNRYLVGQAGKIAEGYFRRNPELGIDFRKNVIILNKTPVHSAKTAQLKYIAKNGGQKIANLIEETELWMAEETANLAKKLNSEIWLVGYSELKPKGIFVKYRDQLKKYADWEKIFVYQHFSMNRFSIDLKEFMQVHKELSLKEALFQLGTLHKNEIFC